MSTVLWDKFEDKLSRCETTEEAEVQFERYKTYALIDIADTLRTLLKQIERLSVAVDTIGLDVRKTSVPSQD